jgi:hypothetical protein
MEKTAGPQRTAFNIAKGALTGTLDFLKTPAGMATAAAAGTLGAVGVLGAMGGDAPSATLSYRVNKGLHGLLDRIKADETVGAAFASSVGKGLGDSMVGLTRDIVTKGYESLKDTLGLSPIRRKIFDTLRKEDLDIASADQKTLMEAYHTLASIAPNLSTDKNAVKSVLRLAATSGGGLDYMTIKGIADAETAINKAKGGLR